jgi:hypothetical protein
MDRQQSIQRQTSLAQYHTNVRQAHPDRQHPRNNNYSNYNQYSNGDQSSEDHLSMSRQRSAARQPSIDALYSRSPQKSMAPQSSINHGQYSVQRQNTHENSLNGQNIPESQNPHSARSYELYTSSTSIPTLYLKPRNLLSYPIPELRPYRDFNDDIRMFNIHVTRCKIIQRLHQAATADANTRGYFPDTGLESIENVDKDFDTTNYTLLYAENLVEPIVRGSARIYASTFGILGRGVEDGVWRVRCWIQPSGQIAKELQVMVKEKLLDQGQVVKKVERNVGKVGTRMSIQEHESLWNHIYEWDSRMRAAWRERF